MDVVELEELWADEGVCAVEVLHEDEVASGATAVDEVADEAVSVLAGAHHGVEVRRGVAEVIDLSLILFFHVHLISSTCRVGFIEATLRYCECVRKRQSSLG